MTVNEDEAELFEALYRAAHVFLVAELKLSGPPSTSLSMDDASRRYWRARGDLIDAHDAIANARMRRRQEESEAAGE